jgi:hypothetical protein
MSLPIKPTCTCHICQRQFSLGVDGIWTADGELCDKCAGVERDQTQGFAWFIQLPVKDGE